MGVHSVEKKQLSAKGMLAKVRSIFEKIPEPPRDPRGVADRLLDIRFSYFWFKVSFPVAI